MGKTESVAERCIGFDDMTLMRSETRGVTVAEVQTRVHDEEEMS